MDFNRAEIIKGTSASSTNQELLPGILDETLSKSILTKTEITDENDEDGDHAGPSKHAEKGMAYI